MTKYTSNTFRRINKNYRYSYLSRLIFLYYVFNLHFNHFGENQNVQRIIQINFAFLHKLFIPSTGCLTPARNVSAFYYYILKIDHNIYQYSCSYATLNLSNALRNSNIRLVLINLCCAMIFRKIKFKKPYFGQFFEK